MKHNLRTTPGHYQAEILQLDPSCDDFDCTRSMLAGMGAGSVLTPGVQESISMKPTR